MHASKKQWACKPEATYQSQKGRVIADAALFVCRVGGLTDEGLLDHELTWLGVCTLMQARILHQRLNIKVER